MSLDGYFVNDVDIDNVDEKELEGIIDELGRLPRGHRYRRSFIKRIRRSARVLRMPATKELTAKAEFEKRMSHLPADIKQDLRTGAAQIVDQTLYGTRLIGGKTQVDVFRNADVKTVGVTNVNNSKLEKGKPMLVTAIRVLAGVGATGDSSQSDIAGTAFTRIPKELASGEFSLKVDGKVLIPEHTVMNIFNTKDDNSKLEGYYRLNNPKWIEPQQEIDFEIELGKAAADKTYVRVELIGAAPHKK